jgi:hypothetical protein
LNPSVAQTSEHNYREEFMENNRPKLLTLLTARLIYGMDAKIAEKLID